ncbi:concanavalin A-like lectin/glucanase [Westerdykella ornata]|uniref:Concanavalin A-like lectin/glucanase n=1 Tax=Westerdykella ornata TaxID=318751 RepID=A0A6A6K1X1_WESOR|nr:concanavalin A-like lectin/glucanase [Westerdykella ornata]KAF2281379.1 concanavalin A-like lectin/glucanase [Westerdykella ornata]
MASSVEDCDCGFTDSHDPTQSTFTSFLAVNFSSIPEEQFNNIFIRATYELTPDHSSYTRNFSAGQVQLSDAGVHLTVSPAVEHQVPCAQIFTRARTFFYGSYHALFRISDVPGTVSAFFNYHNDTSEVDIEHLNAWDEPTLLYTVKPQLYGPSGNPDNSTYQREIWNSTSGDAFHDGFHEWSFVWQPDIVHYGLDSNYSRVITTNVPQAPGRLALSQWSDGNPKYSLGPPTRDSALTIAFLWAVYNDANASALACKKTTSPCKITNGVFQPGNPNASGGDQSNRPPSGTISVNSSAAQSAGASLTATSAVSSWLLAAVLFLWFRSWRA